MLTPRQIHERIAAHLTAELGWTESRHPYGVLFSSASTEVEHLSFAIALPTTTAREPDRRRLRRVETETTVAIRWVYRLRVEAAAIDTRAALDAEAQLMVALRTPALAIAGLGLVLQTATRSSSADGLVHQAEVQLTLDHHYPTE